MAKTRIAFPQNREITDKNLIKIYRENGTTYAVHKTKKYGFIVNVNRTNSIQSVSISYPSGLYYDDIVTNIIDNNCTDILVLGNGCGTVAEYLQQLEHKCTVTGIEPSATMIKIQQEFYPKNKSLVIKTTAQKFFQESNHKFDCIVHDAYINAMQKVKISNQDIKNHLRETGIYIQNNLGKLEICDYYNL